MAAEDNQSCSKNQFILQSGDFRQITQQFNQLISILNRKLEKCQLHDAWHQHADVACGTQKPQGLTARNTNTLENLVLSNYECALFLLMNFKVVTISF